MWTVCQRPPLLMAWISLDAETIGLAAALSVLVISGILAILWVRRWRYEQEPDTVEQQIEHYEDLVRQGLLDPKEFDRIRALLQTQTESTSSSST